LLNLCHLPGEMLVFFPHESSINKSLFRLPWQPHITSHQSLLNVVAAEGGGVDHSPHFIRSEGSKPSVNPLYTHLFVRHSFHADRVSSSWIRPVQLLFLNVTIDAPWRSSTVRMLRKTES
jgi:hypothetical protein